MPRKEAKISKSTPKKHSAVPAAPAAKPATKAKVEVAPVVVAIPAAQQPIVAPATPVVAASKEAAAAPAKPASSTAEAKKVEPEPARDISQLLQDLQSPLGHVRERAAGELGRSENPAACEPLMAALNDSDADVARETAVALGVLGVSAASSALTQVLRNADGFHHTVVRAAAAASLGSLHDAAAVEALVDAVYDSQAEVSAEATRALGEFNTNDRAIDALIDVVRNHNNFFLSMVRRAAVLALGRSASERARNELRFVADDRNEDAVIRQDAARLSYSA